MDSPWLLTYYRGYNKAVFIQKEKYGCQGAVPAVPHLHIHEISVDALNHMPFCQKYRQRRTTFAFYN